MLKKLYMCHNESQISTFSHLSQFKLSNVSHEMDIMAIHYLLSRKTCQQYCANFLDKMQLRRFQPKKGSVAFATVANSRSLCPTKN